jgi:hypothetical protein
MLGELEIGRVVWEPVGGGRPENVKFEGFGFWDARAENRVEFSIEWTCCLYVEVEGFGVW